jgi:heme/copper-type cytochrome/quinol oxidase subunit 3
VLLFLVVFWLVGVPYNTSPGGIAYVASNIYYSSWFTLFSCVYTLNEWSTDKDILSIREIVGVSETLKSWWIHFISAFVVFSSSIQLHMELYQWDDIQDTSFAIALGLASILVSMFYILVHYDFFSSCKCEEGGWAELFSSGFLILVWFIGLSILTQDGKYRKMKMTRKEP